MDDPSPQQSDQRCGSCKQTLPLTDFSPSYRGKTGTWCKACFADYNAGRSRLRLAHDPRTCDWCGLLYIPTQLKAAAAYCSRDCKTKARNKAAQDAINAAKPPRLCPTCGTSLTPRHRSDAVFCSVACSQRAHAVTRKIRKRIGETGPRPRKQPLVSLEFIAKRDGYPCGICGGKVDMTRRHPDPLAASIDHIIPLSRGGSNDVVNLQLSHFRCNWSKKNNGGT
ncbi:MAG TPA: HNH endonuclease signature motif containing protein [Acidimicrobiales bacterium]|nr:HNH endonuclease signature motif containing protein [Acidimicrobiales bacterium]